MDVAKLLHLFIKFKLAERKRLGLLRNFSTRIKIESNTHPIKEISNAGKNHSNRNNKNGKIFENKSGGNFQSGNC
jgi:hypothetical protein